MRCNLGKRVARAAAAGRISDEDAAFDQRQDVTQRGVLGTFCELCPFRCSQLALEVMQETVEYKTLAPVQSKICNCFPKARCEEYDSESGLRAFDGPTQAAQEPIHPGRDVHRAFLCLLQNLVIGGALLPDLDRHAVEALRTSFGARERQWLARYGRCRRRRDEWSRTKDVRARPSPPNRSRPGH